MDEIDELPGDALVEWLEAAESGQQPDLDSILARHPHHATRLRRCHANLEEFQRLTSGLRDSLSSKTIGLSTATFNLGRTLWSPLPVGTPVVDPGIPDYQVESVLGWGGMGIVYKARQLSLDRYVALKVLRPDYPGSSGDADRLRREAALLAHLDHPCIVPIFEFGEHAGHPFFTMRLIEGGKLADCLAHYREHPREAARLLATAARAVHHAHQRGVLHRDLKPSNILLDDKGQPQVTDFGLARLLEADSNLTQSGALVGTPSYMAPEQTLAGEMAISTATDVHALGAVLYAILTEQPPYRGATVVDTLLQVREQIPAPPSSHNTRINRDFDTICLKCLEKKPADRYGSAEALADDLERWLAGLPIQARPIGPWERSLKWARRRPAIAASSAAALACALMLFCGTVYHYEATLLHSSEVERLAEEKDHEARRAQELAKIADARALEARRHAYASQIHLASLKPVAAYPGQMAETLAAVRPRPDEKDLRGFEWHWLWRQAQSHRRFRVQSLGATCACASPDGRVIVAACPGRIEIHDTDSLDLMRTLSTLTRRIDAIAFTRNGKWLIARGYKADETTEQIEIWDFDSGRLHFRSDSRDGGYQISTTADSRHVLYCQQTPERKFKSLLFHTIETGEQVAISWLKSLNVLWAHLAPDNKTLAVLSRDASTRDSLSLYEFSTGRLILRTEIQTDQLPNVAFSPSGALLAQGTGLGQLQIWDSYTGVRRGTFKGPGSNITQIAWSWDDASFMVASQSPNHGLTQFTFWQVAKPSEPSRKVTWEDNVSWSAKLPNKRGHLLLLNNMVHIWNPDTLYQSQSLRNALTEAWFVNFAPDGQHVYAGGDGGYWYAWNISNVQPVKSEPIGSLSSCLAVTRDGSIGAIGCFDEQVHICQMSSMRRLKQFTCGTRPRALAFSPDQGRLAAIGNDGHMRIWNTESFTLEHDLLAHEKRPHGLVYSHDGLWIATGGDDDQLKVWDAHNLTLRYCKSLSRPTAVAFSPADEFLAVGGAGGFITWIDSATGQEINVLMGHTDTVRALAFSPDGRTLASGGQDKSVRLWQVPTGKELLTLPGTKSDVTGLAFSPDSRSLAISRHDGNVELWLPAPGERIDSTARKPLR
jgi:WD40 repeat protein